MFVVQETVKVDASNEGMSPVAIAKQVEYLQQQVTDLHVDQVLGTSQLSLADPQGALQKYVCNNCVLCVTTNNLVLHY